MTLPEGLEERLNAYVDGELGPAERAELDRLLAGSPEARALLAEIQEGDRRLASAFAPLSAEAAELGARLGPRFGTAPARPRAARWLPLALAAGLGFLIGALAFRSGRPDRAPERASELASAPAPGLARLTASTGAVEFRLGPAAAFGALATGAELPAGAEIRTAERAKASFALADGSIVRLASRTTLSLDRPRGLTLASGRIYTEVEPAPERFEVLAGATRIAALGTKLDIAQRVGPDVPVASCSAYTELVVLSGRALLGEREVAAAQRCRALDGQVQEPEPARDLALVSSWANELLSLEGKGEELAASLDQMLALLGRTKMEHMIESEIRSLGDHCVVPLARYVASADPEREQRQRRDAARILADLATPKQAAELVGLLGDADGEVRASAAGGLARMAGGDRDYGAEYWRGSELEAGRAAWQRWLERRE